MIDSVRAADFGCSRGHMERHLGVGKAFILLSQFDVPKPLVLLMLQGSKYPLACAESRKLKADLTGRNIIILLCRF